MKFLSNLDPEKKSNILKYTGIAVLVFTLFTLVSVVSYLFTWQADQSLMSHPDMMEKGVQVENWGGSWDTGGAAFLFPDVSDWGPLPLSSCLEPWHIGCSSGTGTSVC